MRPEDAVKEELSPEEIEAQGVESLEARESMMVVSPGSGGAFAGMAAAGEVAAEPSPMDDVVTIQEEPREG
jgi:1-aminocyclopropane-1-carboxylate deaminase/D-cysteine desulfhydrase-like pyridoxal-dependent ACC family enzyme